MKKETEKKIEWFGHVRHLAIKVIRLRDLLHPDPVVKLAEEVLNPLETILHDFQLMSTKPDTNPPQGIRVGEPHETPKPKFLVSYGFVDRAYGWKIYGHCTVAIDKTPPRFIIELKRTETHEPVLFWSEPMTEQEYQDFINIRK